ncbi:hypothetical protein [Verminephrobacter eiseniae]|uniref:hypothetical protein n=1 Tax=Verminephrobacter eiseniae TaxID=364317 RepID=UPI002238E8E4|nr:hypothetical protein [Verminephrobacter eiseniae]
MPDDGQRPVRRRPGDGAVRLAVDIERPAAGVSPGGKIVRAMPLNVRLPGLFLPALLRLFATVTGAANKRSMGLA